MSHLNFVSEFLECSGKVDPCQFGQTLSFELYRPTEKAAIQDLIWSEETSSQIAL
jgi:hypothetical protein